MDEMGVFFRPKQTLQTLRTHYRPKQTQADAKLVYSLTCWLVDMLTSGNPTGEPEKVYLNLK